MRKKKKQPRKSIDVFGRKFKLELKPGNEADLSDCIGYCDLKKNHIVIQENLPGRVQLQTLFHECWHALYPNQTEENVDIHSLMVFEFLWKNKMLKWPE